LRRTLTRENQNDRMRKAALASRAPAAPLRRPLAAAARRPAARAAAAPPSAGLQQPLTGAERKARRVEAGRLDAAGTLVAVQLGRAGPTPAFLRGLADALRGSELVKVNLGAGWPRDEADALVAAMEAAADCVAVHRVGFKVVFFRAKGLPPAPRPRDADADAPAYSSGSDGAGATTSGDEIEEYSEEEDSDGGARSRVRRGGAAAGGAAAPGGKPPPPEFTILE
jgi:RNA-binding protein YhbY